MEKSTFLVFSLCGIIVVGLRLSWWYDEVSISRGLYWTVSFSSGSFWSVVWPLGLRLYSWTRGDKAWAIFMTLWDLLSKPLIGYFTWVRLSLGKRFFVVGLSFTWSYPELSDLIQIDKSASSTFFFSAGGLVIIELILRSIFYIKTYWANIIYCMLLHIFLMSLF